MVADKNDPLGLIGTTVDGRYQVESLVDEGGFGYVYRAHRVMWDRPVALKLFKARSGNETKQKQLAEAFIAEGKVMNELSQKTTAIVQSFDIGTVEVNGNTLLYTALEWLDGGTLEQLMAQERADQAAPWSVARVVQILEPVVVALDVAHASGVAHRDVKPSNIFLLQENSKIGGVKLLDFGVAKVVEDLADGFDETGTGLGGYTPRYGSPEQFARRHGSTGPWSDVYSLAMVCVELLAGRYPLDAEQFGQLVFAVCDKDVRPTPRTAGVDLGDAVEAVFLKALAVNVDERYRTMVEFWDALRTTVAADQLPDHLLARAATLRSPSTFRPPAALAEAATVPASTTDGQQRSVSEAKSSRSRRGILAAVAAMVVMCGAVWFFMSRGEPTETSAAPMGSASAPAAPAPIDPEHLSGFTPLLPPAITAPDNPLTPEKIDLGRMLFFDKRLSKAGDVSCASCHSLANYGVDGRRVAVGTEGKQGLRNTPSVYHAAGAWKLNWDGSEELIEAHAERMLTDPMVMGKSADAEVRTLKGIAGYRTAFAKAFPEDPHVTMANVGKALGAFQRKLVTPSRWDKFLDGDEHALNDEEKRGFNEFMSVGCVSCHIGTYIGTTMFQKVGLVKAWPNSKDRGLFDLTGQDRDLMMFRVPTLRNVEKTAPYFHDGTQTSLNKSVHMMAHHQLGKRLDDGQADAIVAWLKTLTGDLPSDYIEPPVLP